jgi:hypothetical protein
VTVTVEEPSEMPGLSGLYVLIENPLVASAAPTVAGTTALTIVAAIHSDVTAEINFFICNNSFL